MVWLNLNQMEHELIVYDMVQFEWDGLEYGMTAQCLHGCVCLDALRVLHCYNNIIKLALLLPQFFFFSIHIQKKQIPKDTTFIFKTSNIIYQFKDLIY